MKKILLITILLYSRSLFGQETNDYRINFGVQRNLPERFFNKDLSKFNGQNAGYGFHIYPKWYLNKNLSLGLNIEYAMVREKADTHTPKSFDIFSFSPTINYFLLKNKIRPFVGLGIGLYTVSIADKKLSYGIRPIIGVSLFNRFELSFEYSRIFGDLEINPLVSKGFGNHYVSLKGSYSLKIGRKQKNKP